MITQFYPNPNKKKFWPVTPIKTSTVTGARSSELIFEEFQAKRRGIDLDEYRRRDALIRNAVKDIKYKVGDLVFPYTVEEYEKKGKCRILHIATNYSMLEKDYKWIEGQMPFLVQAQASTTEYSTFLATPGFFRTEEPVAK